MTAYVNVTLFKRNLMRFWPLAVVAFLAAIIIFILPEISTQQYNQPYTEHYSYYTAGDYIIQDIHMTKNIMTTLVIYCVVIAFPLSIFTAIAVFGYLHNQKAAGFVSSLPITRTGLYITNLLSGLTLMLAPLVVVGTLYGILLASQPVPLASWDFLRWIGALIASHFVFYSIAVFCTFLTGNPIMQAFMYAVFNYICMVVYIVGLSIASIFVFGHSSIAYSSLYEYIVLLTPLNAIINMIELMAPQWYLYHGRENNIIVWVIYLALSALMLFFGWLLYRRRNIEVAGEVIVHRPIKSVFKYLAGLFSGVLFALLLMLFTLGGQTNNIITLAVWFTLSTVIFGSLGYLFAEMLIKKRLHVWKSAYKGIIVFILSIIAIVLFIRFDGTGFERRVPNQNDVQSVSVNAAHQYLHYTSIHGLERGFGSFGSDSWHLTWSYRENQQRLGLPLYDDAILQEIKLRTPVYFESPEGIAAVIKLHQTIADHGWYIVETGDEFARYYQPSFTITYTLKNGSILNRTYVLPIDQTEESDLVELLLNIYNQPEAVDKRNRFADLPDRAMLGALVSPVNYDIWLAYTHYTTRMFEGNPTPIFSDESLIPILEALRKDAENGTLGRIRHADLLPGDYNRDDLGTVAVIDLLLDFNLAGVPIAFEQDHLLDEDGNGVAGLVLSIIINEDHVNTIQVLEELGILAN